MIGEELKAAMSCGRLSDWMRSFISYRTGQYKLHYYETLTSVKFVMLTDTQTLNMRSVLHQIYVNLYVEFGKFVLDDGPFTSWLR